MHAGADGVPDSLTAEQAQVEEVLALVDAVLGEAVVGVYLYGSAVMGGLRHDSDLDLLVLTRRTATALDRRALVRGLMDLSGRGRRRPGDRHLELVVVVQSDVRPWRYPPVIDLLYGDWLRADFERGEVPAREARADLVTLLTMARADGRALVGPPPVDVLDPVPPSDLRRAIVAEVPALLDDLGSDTRNVLLTLARVWVTLATGEIRSKDAAAGFAIDRLPDAHRRVLAHARAIYLGVAVERWEGTLADGVRPCADAILAEIHRLAAA